MEINNLEQYLKQYQEMPKASLGTSIRKPNWMTVAGTIKDEINKVWATKKYGQLSDEIFFGSVKGHDVWWLSDLFFECYSEKKFDSFKAWSIIKTHRVKKIKKPTQKHLTGF